MPLQWHGAREALNVIPVIVRIVWLFSQMGLLPAFLAFLSGPVFYRLGKQERQEGRKETGIVFLPWRSLRLGVKTSLFLSSCLPKR